MASVMITGGAGFVGSHTAKRLAKAGHSGIVLDNLSRGHRSFVRWGELIEADIRDATTLRMAFASRRFDAVMHFAALAYVGESVAAPGLYYDVNVAGTRVLLDAMAEAGVDKFVLSSSCAVYGEAGTTSITENTKLEPINPYGMTKLICERMLADFETAYGIRSVRLRYFNAAGADPDCEVGEDHSPETHLIPLVLDVAVGRRPAISILGADYATPDGTAVRDYIHVCDLATSHMAALEHLLRGGPSVTLNLGTGTGISVAELIAEAERTTGRAIPRVLAARRPGDPARLVADSGRAREVLGWQPTHSNVQTILADAWRWHQQRFSGVISARS